MRVIKLPELSGTENLTVSSLFAMKQYWEEGHTFVMRNPRRQSAFLWFCGCVGTFRTGSAVLTVPKGSLVYIPEGSVYSLTFSDCLEGVSTLLIEFCPSVLGQPIVLAPQITVLETAPVDPAVCEIITRMTNEFAMPERPYLSLTGNLYRLLSLLAGASEQRRISKRGLSTIEAGIRYLQTDEKQALSLDEVAAMCFVTPAYFRRLFQKYAGVSPSEYRTARRIERAKELLRNSAMSVSAISETLGFESPSYFCRVFKQRTGVSPLAYQKEKCIEK